MIRNTIKNLLFLIALVFMPFLIQAQPNADEGKELFKNNCAQCHAKNMKSAATGPALGGMEERWADYPREDLYAWIRNSQAQIASGHPKAVELWNQYKPVVMQPFPNLTDDNIESLIIYINGMYDGSLLPKQDTAAATEAAKQGTPSWIYYLLLAFLAILSVVLARVITNLNFIAAKKEGRDYERKTLFQTLTSKGVVGFVLFAAVILGGYTTVNNAVSLGRQQGYAPDQPIKFSHETHAGLHKIDCQYCHDGARRSKHAVIPSANTCMNCHRAIKVGTTYGTAELTKIYASIGYNPNDNTYMEDYNNMSQEDIRSVYSKWIGDNYLTENQLETLDKEGERVVEEQWSHVVESLTNEQKKKVQGPIEWERIHNLPDHVYFNHAQHVAVGQLECQQCHGTVEEMPVLEQHAPLSMGWCVNCHRQTEVKFASNEYYKSYELFHEELASGKRDKVTVEDIGGLECQKCHY
ncbi:MAG: c-type cytochrome [Saprospiraceae bacterium]|nr:c-type cytochrome [Bacteroidia bacterium]NNF20357.1 c-type cytochrome [Saprospiraceae bacterium]NNK89757.1 c-type cytochrome [Saprospiraceae bacterium]